MLKTEEMSTLPDATLFRLRKAATVWFNACYSSPISAEVFGEALDLYNKLTIELRKRGWRRGLLWGWRKKCNDEP